MTEHTQVVDNDRVFCSRRHRDIDIEACLACRSLVGLKSDAGVRFVVCRAETRSLIDLIGDTVHAGFPALRERDP